MTTPRPGAWSVVALALLGAGPAVARAEALPCLYTARATKAEPAPELDPHEDCASLASDGSLRIRPGHLRRMAFVDDRAAVLVADQWYYVAPDGRSAPVISFDNGADPFREGRARTARAGRIGYIDEKLRVVIPARYDFAWPFENGRALVCVGCRRDAPDSEGHTPVVGGRWGYIDASGKVVVPIRSTHEEALSASPR